MDTEQDDRDWLVAALANLVPMLERYENARGADVWTGLLAMKLGASEALRALEEPAVVRAPSTG